MLVRPVSASDATARHAEQRFLPASLPRRTGGIRDANVNDAAAGTDDADAADDAANGAGDTTKWTVGSGKLSASVLPSFAHSVFCSNLQHMVVDISAPSHNRKLAATPSAPDQLAQCWATDRL